MSGEFHKGSNRLSEIQVALSEVQVEHSQSLGMGACFCLLLFKLRIR